MDEMPKSIVTRTAFPVDESRKFAVISEVLQTVDTARRSTPRWRPRDDRRGGAVARIEPQTYWCPRGGEGREGMKRLRRRSTSSSRNRSGARRSESLTQHYERSRLEYGGEMLDQVMSDSLVAGPMGTAIRYARRIASCWNGRRRQPLDKILGALIEIVESASTTGVLGSILLLDEDEKHLRTGAAPSLPPEYCAAINGAQIGPKAGSCGTAAFTGTPVFVTDIATDPLWEDFRDVALPHGLRSCWSIPILTTGRKVLGTFAMYHREPREPTVRDLALAICHSRCLGHRSQASAFSARESERSPVELAQAADTVHCTIAIAAHSSSDATGLDHRD